jgi:DNA repair exonuclease SbcCD ATPase subunit
MRLVSITLNDVRCFAHPVRIGGIGSGLNVLSAPNENGKSTLFDALHAVFFTPHRSRGKEIKALKPHVGGAPEVSVEIDTDDGRFRIFKRWTSKETAEVWQGDRLVAKADEAEAWISGLTTSGGEGGPAGLLWVRQGMTQLDHDRAKENQTTLSTRRDLMSSVTGEVEALTGGKRMDMALARARGDLAVLLTAGGRVRADGPLAKAEAEVASLTARQTELAETASQLATALTRRVQVRRALAELQDPVAEADRRTRLAEATAAHEAASRHAEALRQADLAVKMARLEAAEAAGKLDALAQARDRGTAARRAEAEAQALAQAARGSLAAAEATAQARLAEVTAARTRRSAAETVLRTSLRAQTARGDDARRRDLTARMTALAALSADLAARRAAAASGPDTKVMAALEAQFQQVSVLRSLRTSSATRISVTYSGPLRIALDGTELPEGQTTPILTETVLALPGLGDLTIRPGETSDIATRLQKAEADLDAQLTRSGCATVEDARAAARLRAEALAAVTEIETRISTLAPQGIAAVEAELARMPAPAPGDDTVPEVAEAQGLSDAAADALQTAERAFDAARNLAETERMADVRAAVAAQSAAGALHAAGAALTAFGDLAVAEADLSGARDTASRVLAEAIRTHTRLADAAPDLAQAEAALSRARSVVTGADLEIGALSEERAKLDTEIELRSGIGVAEDLADVGTRLAAARTRLDRLLFEVAVLKDLIAALETARDTARERYFAPVMAELRPLLHLLWPDAELKFDGESLLPTALVRNGREEDIGILSGGTQEQIALFVRLAFARLLARTGRHAPVILDDALVYTDDDRIERVFDLLHGQANDLQIIVLTCRQRAFRALGGQKLHFAPIPDPVAFK